MFNTFIKVFLIGMITSLFLTGCSESNGSSSSSSDPITGEVINVMIHGTEELIKNDSAQLNAIGLIKDDSGLSVQEVNHQVDWTTSDETIAVVDGSGMVIARKDGNVTITAVLKDNTSIGAVHKLAVKDVAIQSLQIEYNYNEETPSPISDLNVTVGTEEYITVWAIDSNSDRHYVNPDAFWWSSDQQIASINSFKSSKVYGRDLGTATVTAYYKGLTDSVAVTVIPEDGVTLESIEIREMNQTIMPTNVEILVTEKRWVEAWGHYSDQSVRNINSKVFWSSSDLSTAWILDEINSYVTGASGGTATITANWQGKSASVNFNVTGVDFITLKAGENSTDPVPGTIIDIDNPLTIKTGGHNRVYVEAYGMYADGIERYINNKVFWRSNDYSIASMSILQLNSWVTGESAGSTVISASLLGVQGKATVVVTAP